MRSHTHYITIINYSHSLNTDVTYQKIADNINDIEEFGDLPSPLLHRLGQILSKRRALTSRTLNLFLRPDLDSINIYDSASMFIVINRCMTFT